MNGTFAGLGQGAEIVAGSNTVDYTPNTVALVAFPEPGNAAMLLSGLASLDGLGRVRCRESD